MRLVEILFISFVGLLVFSGMPFPHGKVADQGKKMIRQEQEAPTMVGEKSSTYVVIYKSQDISEEDTADISWLKKAAELGVKNGLPYFNVQEQNSYKRFSKKADAELTTIEGTVEFTNDPMSTDYDAREILSLIPEE